MPEVFARQGEPNGDRPRSPFPKNEAFFRARVGKASCINRLFPRLVVLFLCLLLWPGSADAQSDGDDHRFDIGIVIDNRPRPRSADAREDVNNLIALIDSQMFIDHVMVFERPTMEVICDVFGCPEALDPDPEFPSLLWQITRRETSRIFVYYIGDGRTEGLQRQLLFSGQDGGVAGLSVDWLHAMLDEAEPASAVLMLDTAFAPRQLPCASEDPRLIDDALLDIRRNYLRIARDRWNRRDVIELSATTPVQPAHCDRFDLALEDLQQPLFTKFFLKGVVEGEADDEPFGDENGLIEHGELADYLNDRISRAARFHWGRRQNVRVAGSRSHRLASVDPVDVSERAQDVIDRRNSDAEENEPTPAGPVGGPPGSPPADQPIDPAGDPGIAGGDPSDGEALSESAPELQREPEPGPEPEIGEPRCGEDLTADDCHPCVLEPGGAACLDHCERDAGSTFCSRFLTASTEPGADLADSGESGAGGIEVVPLIERGDEAPSAACDFAATHVAPYASALVGNILGGVEPSCTWATDRSEVERGPFAQIFTPIAWRLGRERAQNMVHCLLDCGGVESVDESVPPETLPAQPEVEETPPPRAQVDPRTLGAFNRHVCDRLHEPLPAYIGLPRWMPGTLMVSEGLRAAYGCPPPAAPVELPTPLAVAIAPPPERDGPATPGDGAPAVAAVDEGLSPPTPYAAGLDTSEGGETPAPPLVSPDIVPVPEGTSRIASGPAAEGEGAPERDATEGVQTADAGSPPGRAGGTAAQQPPAFSAEPPFVPTRGRIHWLQMALTVDNRDPGPIDGFMGPRTLQAIRSWRRSHGREGRTGPLTEPEFQKIIEEFGERFEQIHARVRGL